jgi:phage tail protein X
MRKVKVYKTVSGDTWDLISYKIYGSEQYFHQLMRTNLNLLSIAVFDSNIPIIVPELDTSINADNISKLPPWKR